MSLQNPLQNSLLTQLFRGRNFFLIWRFEPCSLKVNIFLLPFLVYVRLPDICIFTELQDESLLIHKGWMVIKNANVYKIIGMLCFNALWQVHRFVLQVYGWIVYKINKLAPKWKKKSFPFVSVVDSLLSCLEGILEWISSTCLLCIIIFPL